MGKSTALQEAADEQETAQGRNDSRSSKVRPAGKLLQAIYVGIPASPGVVIGTLCAAPTATALEAAPDETSTDPDAEKAVLETAIHAIYRELPESFVPRPVTLRTLDAGGDKPLPY